MLKNKDESERIINSYVKRHSDEYQYIGLVVEYIYQQFDQLKQFQAFSYEEIFEELNLNDYYQNEFDYSFFFSASVFLLNQIGFKIFPNGIKNQFLVIKTI